MNVDNMRMILHVLAQTPWTALILILSNRSKFLVVTISHGKTKCLFCVIKDLYSMKNGLYNCPDRFVIFQGNSEEVWSSR